MNQATTSAPPRRLRADAVRNQQRIVAAAQELFAAHGLEITLDDVAERAGVGVGTVYRRFSNKRELITEVFEQHLCEFTEAAERSLEHPDPWSGLVGLFEYACRHLATNRGFSDVLLELEGDPARFVELRDRLRPAVDAVVQRAIDAGALAPDVTMVDFFALIHMVDALAEFAHPVNTEVWRRYMAIALNGIRSDTTPRVPLAVPPLTDDEVEHAKEATCMGRRR